LLAALKVKPAVDSGSRRAMTKEPPSSRSEAGPGDAEEGADDTLGGYLARHDRPPAFQGPDGHPYTVSPEVEQTGNLLAPYSGYLVFPRWAESGIGIVGHVETPTLLEARTREEADASLASLTLLEVQELLEAAIRRNEREAD
jgi:hypothetical protein